MRATIKNYVEAANRRRQEEGDEGFSLIELIIVVVILGVLVAIAIPVFGAIQAEAQRSAVEAAAANGATAVAAALGDNNPATTVAAALEASAREGIDIASTNGESDRIDQVCVTATLAADTAITTSTGPGCSAAP